MAPRKSITVPATSFAPSITPDRALARLERLSVEISNLREEEGLESPVLDTWRNNVQGVLAHFYGQTSLQYEQFERIRFYPFAPFDTPRPSEYVRERLEGLTRAEGFLRSRIDELKEDLQESQAQPFLPKTTQTMNTHKVFIVHGHDHGSKEAVARFLSKLDLEPIILHERPDQGRTIIEKFEHYADVPCAVVILSPDDMAYSKSTPSVQEHRARQNVIFELGFFLGRLGRKHTFALVQKGMTQPSDIDGVLYIPMEDDTWRIKLVSELKAAGMDVDANKAFG